MTTYTDTFTRADSATTLGSTETGQTWTAHVGTWGISSNQAYVATSGGTNNVASFDVGTSDMDVTVTYVVPTTATFKWSGPCARVAAGGNSFYSVEPDSNWKLLVNTAGTYTSLHTSSVVPATGDVVRLVVAGSSISYYINGTLVTTVTNTAVTTGTRAGLRMNSSGVTAGVRLDNLTVTTSTGPSDAPTGLTATAGNAQVSLSWTAPANNNGSAITDYVIEFSTNGGGSWSTISDGTSTATTYTHTGLTNGTAYTYRVSAVNGFGTSAASSTASATPFTVIAPNSAAIVYSPYNWVVTSVSATTINGGAYFKTQLDGSVTSVALKFDVTSQVGGSETKVLWKIDGKTVGSANLAASVNVTIPSVGNWTKHLLEVVMMSSSEGVNRWNVPSATAVVFQGLVLTPGSGTLTAPTKRGLNVLCFGDSITEGIQTLGSGGSDATVGWAYLLGDNLGAEVGVVGFGLQGLATAGNGNVPVFGSAYNLIYSGQSRDFTTFAPDAVVINQGTNDGATNTTTTWTAVLNGLITALPSTTKIVVLRPFNGNSASFIQAGIAACSAPSRVTYVDTTGWFNATADGNGGGLHPLGYINLTKLSPLVASAVRSAIGVSTAKQFVNVGGVARAVGTVIKA